MLLWGLNNVGIAMVLMEGILECVGVESLSSLAFSLGYHFNYSSFLLFYWSYFFVCWVPRQPSIAVLFNSEKSLLISVFILFRSSKCPAFHLGISVSVKLELGFSCYPNRNNRSQISLYVRALGALCLKNWVAKKRVYFFFCRGEVF